MKGSLTNKVFLTTSQELVLRNDWFFHATRWRAISLSPRHPCDRPQTTAGARLPSVVASRSESHADCVVQTALCRLRRTALTRWLPRNEEGETVTHVVVKSPRHRARSDHERRSLPRSRPIVQISGSDHIREARRRRVFPTPTQRWRLQLTHVTGRFGHAPRGRHPQVLQAGAAALAAAISARSSSISGQSSSISGLKTSPIRTSVTRSFLSGCFRTKRPKLKPS